MFCSPRTNFETINNMHNHLIQSTSAITGRDFWHSKLVRGLRFAKLASLTNQI